MMYRMTSFAAVLLLASVVALADPASPELKAAYLLCQTYRAKPPPFAPNVHYFHSFAGWEHCEKIHEAWQASDEGKNEASGEKKKEDDKNRLDGLVPQIPEIKQ